LPPGDYTVTPALDGYTFDPENRPVPLIDADVTGKNFTATGALTISGTITSDDDALEGVTVTAAEGKSALTDEDGNYSIEELPPGDYTVTPALDGYTFDPENRPVPLIDADVTGKNFTATQQQE